jgi:hypothetical protein
MSAKDAFDKFEDQMRQDTIGDEAHQKLFALAKELEAKDAVRYKKIIERCRNGHYHDFATKATFPKMDMHNDLIAVELTDVDSRMQDGEFDS